MSAALSLGQEMTQSRRRFLQSAAKLGLVSTWGLAACSGPGTTPAGPALTVEGSDCADLADSPTTDRSIDPSIPGLHQRLDTLVARYEEHGLNVASGLRPPATEAQIDGVSEMLGFALPADVRELWSWHNGWVASPTGDPPWFRDNWLSGTPEVLELMETMSGYDYESEVDISRCVPIAHNEGSVYAVATGAQSLLPGHPLPVIQFFEGVFATYHSIATMIDTAVAWVSAPGYDPEVFNIASERSIWQCLNPDLPTW